MTATGDSLQRITLLAPVADAVSRLDASVASVAAANTAPNAAIGATLAADILAPLDLPPRASALHDGWAVASEETVDASAYAPVLLRTPPPWVNAAQPLPAAADAVLPVDAVSITGAGAEIHVPAAKGEGVLPSRFDVAKGVVLRKAGERVRPLDAALLCALAIETIAVRLPRVKIFPISPYEAHADMIGPVIADAVRVAGGKADVVAAASLELALSDRECDAVITIGGTGSGRNDVTVKSLARMGKVEFHGIGISPGQTTAFGSVNGRPVLALPGRLDAALAGFLVIGRELMMRLAAGKKNETGVQATLVKKITSTIGLAEVVFVRLVTGGIEPLGSGVLPLQAFAEADGWVLVSADSEGFPAGANVQVRSLS
jgi:molybdopterin biosynthesis enzyme